MVKLNKKMSVRTKFYIWSDLHTELLSLQRTKKLCREIFVRDNSANLILAGDIGKPNDRRYLYLLHWCAPRYNKIFIIAGNHEHYQTKKEEQKIGESVHQDITAMCRKYSNVYYLDKSVYLDENYIILGCTLWTIINQFEHSLVEQVYNDFKYIPNIDINGWHKQDVSWLKSTLEYYKDDKRKKIIVTHHMPTYKLIDAKYKKSPINSAFANTDCDDINPDYWIYGHTHAQSKVIMNNCAYICNPVGYEGENVWYPPYIIQV